MHMPAVARTQLGLLDVMGLLDVVIEGARLLRSCTHAEQQGAGQGAGTPVRASVPHPRTRIIWPLPRQPLRSMSLYCVQEASSVVLPRRIALPQSAPPASTPTATRASRTALRTIPGLPYPTRIRPHSNQITIFSTHTSCSTPKPPRRTSLQPNAIQSSSHPWRCIPHPTLRHATPRHHASRHATRHATPQASRRFTPLYSQGRSNV